MQQPYLMGVKSGEALISAIKGETPEKQILVPIIVATSKNIDQILPTIKADRVRQRTEVIKMGAGASAPASRSEPKR